MAKQDETHGEVGMIGAFFGGILGGMVFGATCDLARLPVNSLALYALGVVVGALFGTVAANVIARKLSQA